MRPWTTAPHTWPGGSACRCVRRQPCEHRSVTIRTLPSGASKHTPCTRTMLMPGFKETETFTSFSASPARVGATKQWLHNTDGFSTPHSRLAELRDEFRSFGPSPCKEQRESRALPKNTCPGRRHVTEGANRPSDFRRVSYSPMMAALSTQRAVTSRTTTATP